MKARFAEFHFDILRDLRDGTKRLVYATPREHGKSTLIDLVYVLWCICYQKKNFILVVSDSYSQAQKFLAAVKYELETNEPIRKVFGDLVPKEMKWAEKEFITTTGIMVSSSGNGSNLRGLKHREHRPDLIIGDDLENDEHVSTPRQRDKTWSWFTKSFLNLGGPDTQIIVIGTILHYGSLLARLLSEEFKDVWTKRRFEAETNGVPLWQEVWSMERLMARKKEIGSEAYATEFLNRPSDSANTPVKREWIRRSPMPDTATLDIVIAIDPAISQKETADYFALCVIGRHSSGKIYILESYKTRCNVTDQVALVVNYHATYPKAKFRIETVAYQKALSHLIADQRKNGVYIAVSEFTPDKDKLRRVKAIAPYIERGDVLFVSNRGVDDLVASLTDFPFAAHDDDVDSMTSALESFVHTQRRAGLYVG